ncbi:excisionase family DNA-binding protein [Streptomyces misionensis]|uniref:excisionase family DNA-binding protein n=1 Tax=Streptomyces misionensis TaxID=67331 RepID=UPI00367DE593
MSENETNEEFLMVREVAAWLRVSSMTVLRLIHAGQLDAIRVGRTFRVKESSFKAFVAKGGVQ